MQRNRLITGALVSIALVVGLFIGTRAVRADGIPNDQPLYYSGYLTDGATPVEGERDVTVIVWDDATAGTNLCSTSAPSTEFKSGRFRVPLSTDCVTAVQQNPDVWVELIVDTITFGRNKVGAVPYAVVAEQSAVALGASGMLASNITQIQQDLDTLKSGYSSSQSELGELQSAVAALQSSVGSLSSDVSSLESTATSHGSRLDALESATLPYFHKPGNNGTATCDVYCAGSQWGQLGTCVGAQNASTGEYVSCSTTVGGLQGLRCWCSRPTL